MKEYSQMSIEELEAELSEQKKKYKGYEQANLSLNMARGKPSPSQLDLSEDLIDNLPWDKGYLTESGDDVRNYGLIDGIPEAKKLMSEMLECRSEQVVVFGNASLNIMYDVVDWAFVFGIDGEKPWGKQGDIKFLCPVPGYDRHFSITEGFGIEMINIPMTDEGPDMDMVEKYVNNDASVKGIWCVPKYSNPQGISYSDETVKRFATLKPKAKDFRIFWDNAYCVHHLYDDVASQDKILNILDECEKAGNPDIVYEFASTSKVTFAGAGISCMASSVKNLDEIRKRLSIQTIGYDKINQWRHVKFLKNRAGIDVHMKKHAAILRPKFETVMKKLDEELIPLGLGSYVAPKGGYFVCYEAPEGTAAKAINMAKEAGVVMTGAGAPFPYKKDPKDSVVRIAPSYPEPEELDTAMEIFVCCVKIAYLEKKLGK